MNKNIYQIITELQREIISISDKGKITNDFINLIEEVYFTNKLAEKFIVIFDPNQSTWHLIHKLLKQAAIKGKAQDFAKHLVGAKLQLRFPEITIGNQSTSAADDQTHRPGDFLIGDTAFHVTVSPMPSVFNKCLDNISQGYKPFLLVPDDKLIGSRQNALQICSENISVESIESFVSQNIDEISIFKKDNLTKSVKDLIEIYNHRVDEVEFDKSLMIDLPKNIL